MASTFDYNNCTIISVKSGEGYRIFILGEPIGDTTLAYYIGIPNREHAVSYSYPSETGMQENAHFTESKTGLQNHYMNIIGLDSSSFKEAAKIKAKDLITIRLDSVEDLVSAAIKRGIAADSLYNLYSFDYKGRQVLCGFDVIEELSDDTRILYYALPDTTIKGKFARYKYSENKIDFTDYMGEHSYMYAKIIPLAEPYPFFKVPD